MTVDPKNSVDASLDLLMTTLKGHLVACACKVLGIEAPNEPVHIPDTVLKGRQKQKQAYISLIASDVVNEITLVWEAFHMTKISETGDTKHNYARVLCHYCSLVLNFIDAWAEGDGERVFESWRLFLPHLYVSHRTKYALEALQLQFQIKAVLSPHLSHHIKWDRFVNKDGGEGRNIPCDLQNEHVNKLVKEVIVHMGPNLTENALQRIARSVTTLDAVCNQFDKQSGVILGSNHHSTRSDIEDVHAVAKVVIDNDLLIHVHGRKHQNFKGVSGNPLWNLDKEKMKKWITAKKKNYLKYKQEVVKEISQKLK